MATPTPAWKRLGLKLKYAKDEPDRPSTVVPTKAHDLGSELSERPAKRRRIAKNESPEPLRQNGSYNSTSQIRESNETPATNGSGSLLTGSQQPRQRKKSVTFSEETKQDDGDSRITIDFPAGSPGSTPKKPTKASKHSLNSEPPEGLTSAEKNTSSAVANDQSTPTKKPSKVNSGKKSKTSKGSSKDKSSTALDYLNQHRLDRESWKFNKIIDVWILNHALENQAIPPTYVPALAGYVKGLPEKAGSRTRLVKECKEALATSQLNADSNDEDRSLFIKFLDSQTGSLQDAASLESFLQSHSRPGLLLWALNETADGQSSRQEAGLVVRKKKSRTSAPIDISSSSESDSDSDSSDDSSDSETENKTDSNRSRPKVVNGSTSKDETSSSDSTSSSEDESEDSTSSDSSSSSEDDQKPTTR